MRDFTLFPYLVACAPCREPPRHGVSWRSQAHFKHRRQLCGHCNRAPLCGIVRAVTGIRGASHSLRFSLTLITIFPSIFVLDPPVFSAFWILEVTSMSTCRQRLARLAINDQGFAFDPQTGESFTLNRTARECLRGLAAGEEPGKLVRDLSEAYVLDAKEIEADLRDFVEQLRSLDLMEVEA